jgi:hypothetical protein
MCGPKKQKIEKADPVVAAPPPAIAPMAPVLNEATTNSADATSAKRRGKKALVIPLAPSALARPQIGVNVPN